MRLNFWSLGVSAGCAALLSAAAPAAAHDVAIAVAPSALADVSLEELFAQEVSSVAKKPQNLKEASAAVFVIGREDIRRSGATTLQDLLRMVPGVEVATLPNATAAVTVRGFNSGFASKVLILLDGRSIYNPAISSVTWSEQLVPLEDVERIEVVRGPGASLWGANAVNGVINIITKHAVDSLGGAGALQIDSHGDKRAYLRQGFQVGENGALRLSAQVRREHSPIEFDGARGEAYFKGVFAGLRYDVAPTQQDAFTFQADYIRDQSGDDLGLPNSYQLLTGDMDRVTVLGRWTRSADAGSRTSVQAYYDNASGLYGPGHVRTRVVDLDISRQQPLGEHHDLVLGVGFRRTGERFNTGAASARVQHDWYGGYIQDEVKLLSDRLRLTAGVKVEHNPLTGLEVQPTARAIWVDPRGWAAWAAYSRAVRTPADIETETYVELAPDGSVVRLPGKVDPETLTAFELGWRGPLSEKVRLDVTAFYHRYDDLIAAKGGLEFPNGRPTLVFRPDNVAHASSYGIEAALDARVTSRWTLKAAASTLNIDVDEIAGPIFSYGAVVTPQSPKVQGSIRSLFDLREDMDFDVTLRHVGKLSGGVADAYQDLDIRLAWRPNPRLEFALAGENLLSEERIEFNTSRAGRPTAAAVIQRRVRLTLSTRY